jgi:hypothetical protein
VFSRAFHLAVLRRRTRMPAKQSACAQESSQTPMRETTRLVEVIVNDKHGNPIEG